MPADFRLPGPSHRTTIIGRTGSGKSTLAAWLLGQMDWHRRPWVVINHKGDELLDAIPNRRELAVTARIPRKPGVYMVHPMLGQESEVEQLLWRIWQKGRTGVLVDEAYLMPDKDAFPALLITGRSKQIPMIMNTQRPSWVPRHMWSESDFFSVFHLNHRRDQRAVEEFIPIDMSGEPLPEFHSRWYDVGRNKVWRLLPVPEADSILDTFAARDGERPALWNGFTWLGPSKIGLRWS